MIVTIDGPAGAGKSSAARQLAIRIGFAFLDTGAMYRAVTWVALDREVNPSDFSAVEKIATKIDIQFVGDRVVVDGKDVSVEIRSSPVTIAVSEIADNPQVRQLMVNLQREIASNGNFVCEGRDQGTVVFPNAKCKIFLTATPEARAKRRVSQLKSTGTDVDFQDVLSDQNERDRRDESRPVGGLKMAVDAIKVLSDDLSLDEVVDKLESIISSCMAKKCS